VKTTILSELCSIPTAPFAEHRVYEYARRFAQKRKRLRVAGDRWGNLLLELPGRRARSAKSRRVVFVAHTDHPGLVARRMIDRRTVQADFRGGVLSEFVRGARVRFFNEDDSEVPGRVIETVASKDRANFPSEATVRVNRAVDPGAPGMFDEGTARAASSPPTP
jgi:putative aminopeptidase FrvX